MLAAVGVDLPFTAGQPEQRQLVWRGGDFPAQGFQFELRPAAQEALLLLFLGSSAPLPQMCAPKEGKMLSQDGGSLGSLQAAADLLWVLPASQ